MTDGIAMKAYRREADLASPVTRFLRNRAFRLQGAEIQFFENSMDLYAYSAKADCAVAVELKLERWSRAVEQALLYQLCADMVYIAMPVSSITKVDLAVLKEHGIGLIAVSVDRCQEIVPAQPSTVLRKHYRAERLAALGMGS